MSDSLGYRLGRAFQVTPEEAEAARDPFKPLREQTAREEAEAERYGMPVTRFFSNIARGYQGEEPVVEPPGPARDIALPASMGAAPAATAHPAAPRPAVTTLDRDPAYADVISGTSGTLPTIDQPQAGGYPSRGEALAALPAGGGGREPTLEEKGYRAIRMPNGTMLFTNRAETGGEELSLADAGRVVRRQDRDQLPTGVDPKSLTMRSLLQASLRANPLEPGPPAPEAPIRGRMVAGTPYDTTPTATQMPGESRQVAALALEQATGAAELAGARAKEREAAMTPQEKAALNPAVMISAAARTYRDDALKELFAQINQQTQEIKTKYTDPTQRAKELRSMLERSDREYRRILGASLIGSGEAVPSAALADPKVDPAAQIAAAMGLTPAAAAQ